VFKVRTKKLEYKSNSMVVLILSKYLKKFSSLCGDIYYTMRFVNPRAHKDMLCTSHEQFTVQWTSWCSQRVNYTDEKLKILHLK
jgi:hypothetical protein